SVMVPFWAYHNELYAPAHFSVVPLSDEEREASDISIPSITSLSLFSNVSITNSRVLSSILPGSVCLNSFTALLSALLQTTLTIAPGTPWPVQSQAAIKMVPSTVSIQ